MDPREYLIKEVYTLLHHNARYILDTGDEWDRVIFMRTCMLRIRHGDRSAWSDWIALLERHIGYCGFTYNVRWLLQKSGRLEFDHFDECWSVQPLPEEVGQLDKDDSREFLQLMERADEHVDLPDQRPSRKRSSRSFIKYIESKPGLTGDARIGRVLLSKSGKTLYYCGQRFQSLNGAGYKANYFCLESGMSYWISNCRIDGRDTLYPGIVSIDEKVREEYWLKIRKQPELLLKTSFRSPGKYSKREPR